MYVCVCVGGEHVCVCVCAYRLPFTGPKTGFMCQVFNDSSFILLFADLTGFFMSVL